MTITIRLAGTHDAGAVSEIYAPAVADGFTSFEAVPPDAAEMAGRIERTLPDHPWLVCEREGTVAGYAYAGPHRKRAAYRWSVDVSVYVHPDHRRRGVGRGLYESLFEILRLQGFVNAYAGIALPNPASVGLHESFGFEQAGVYEGVGYKRGEWRDVGWWQLALAEKVADPASPLSIEDVRGSSGWDDSLAAGERIVRESGRV